MIGFKVTSNTMNTTLLNDGICEANLRSLIENTKTILENQEDYRARAEFMLDCTYGCNGILALGNSGSGWPCHGYHIFDGFFFAVYNPIFVYFQQGCTHKDSRKCRTDLLIDGGVIAAMNSGIYQLG